MSGIVRVSFVCLMLSACGATDNQLKTRAAFDLKCEAAQVEIVEIDSRTRGVRGCGQQATYVENCSNPGWNSGCTWVLNTDGTDDKKPE